MGRPKKDKVVKVKTPRVKKVVKEVKTKQTGNMKFFDKLVSATKNELAQAASNGIIASDIENWIDTGVYYLNAQLSGSLYGGVPDNKIIVWAGPSAVGKTFFILALIKHFLDMSPEGAIFLFESENGITQKMLIERNIDMERVYIIPVSTIQEWKTQSLKVLASYKETKPEDRRPMMFVLDSLGQLSTTKEMADSEEGKETQDMTRTRLIKGAFRTLTLKMGILKIPFQITNHTYETQGLFSTKVMSGGSGVAYANSITVFLSKSKDKQGEDIIGAILHSVLKKSRFTKENTKIDIKLDYAKGLNRYYGLLDLALKYDIAKEVVKSKGKYVLGGKEGSEKTIYNRPEDFFTKEVMDQLEVAAGKEFNYGSAIEIPTEEETDETNEEIST